MNRSELEFRFWRKVNKDGPNGCWIWTASRFPRGYGQAKNSLDQYAHRVSWILKNGPIKKGKWVLHKCDVPECVNPDHLFLGNAKSNHDDMVSKGRQRHATGESAGLSKLKEHQVLDIRRRYFGGQSQRSIAKCFGVARGTVWAILRGITWRKVKS